MAKIWEIFHKFKLHNLLLLQNRQGETCLHLAAALNKGKILMELLHYGADSNAVDQNGDTALHVAVKKNYEECVATLLLNDKIDLNILNDNGFAPLHLAIKNKNLNAVKMIQMKALASKVSCFSIVETKHGNNALHIAIESGAKEIAEYILRNHLIKSSAKNLSGHTPLFLANALKDSELVKLLLKYNVDEKVSSSPKNVS